MQISQRRFWRYLTAVFTIAFAYVVTAEIVITVPVLQGNVSAVWPPSGVALAGLLGVGLWAWPGVLLGVLILDFGHGASWAEAIGSITGSTLQAVVGVALLRQIGFHTTFNSLRDVLGFVGFGAIVSPCVNATLSVLSLYLLRDIGWGSVGQFWGTFWLGDSMGILVVTPLILTSHVRHLKALTSVQWMERGMWLLVLAGVSGAVYGIPFNEAIAQYPLEYLPYPIVVWAALRFGLFGGVLGNFLLSAIAIWGTTSGFGPFVARATSGGHSILLLQAFMGVTTVTTLVIAAAEAQRQQTEQLLRRSEASLSNAQRIAHLGNWDFDVLHDQWNWSHELYSLLGLNPKTTQPGPDALLAVVHADDRPKVLDTLQQALYHRRPYSLNYRIVRSDSERLVREQVEVRSTGITGTVQDITEQTHSEVALRESQEKFSKAFGFSPDAITISTLEDGRFIDVNESFLRMTGYRRDEVIGRTSYDLNIWANYEDRSQVKDIIRREGAVRNQEYMFLNKAGGPVICLASIEIINLSGTPYLLCVARDITERKLAEEHLRLANERDRLLGEMALRIRQSLDLNEMLETTVAEVRRFLQADRVFICQFDAHHKGTVAAESVSLDCSSTLGHVIDADVYSQLQEIFSQRRVCAMPDTSKVEHSQFFEECVRRYQVRASIGVPITVGERLFGVMVAHQCSTIRNWTAFESELLERLATQVAIAVQQAELYQQVQDLNVNLEHQVAERTAELHQKMQELQEMNTLRDFFLHAVAHDLSTTAKGTLLLLTNLQHQEGDQVMMSRPVLDRMIQAGEKQLNKLNSLQEAYILKSQGMQLQTQPVSLQSVVEDSLEQVQDLYVKYQATLTTLVSSELPPVNADVRELGWVLHQLLSNAVMHNPPGIHVTLRTELKHGQIYCFVEDNGLGISPERCDRLFDLCIGCPSDPQLTGISLGLYRCRQVIAAHHGEIGVESRLGEGTAFWFTLPVQQG